MLQKRIIYDRIVLLLSGRLPSIYTVALFLLPAKLAGNVNMTTAITNITRTTDGIYWRYAITATGNYDVWLDGTLLSENETGATYDLLSGATRPPEVEVCDYGARPMNAWACRRMQIQWYADDNDTFAVQEWRSNVLYSTQYVTVPYPNRYASIAVEMATGGTIAQTWTVRAAVLHDNGQYSISGMPITVAVNRHYLPPAPVVRYSWNATTRKVTIR